MVQISVPPALMKTYYEKCRFVQETNVRTLVTLCGLDKPAVFKSHLSESLSKGLLKTDDQIKAFINLTAPHTNSNNLVFQLFRNTVKSFELFKGIELLQKYQDLPTLNLKIQNNEISYDQLSLIDKELLNPESDLVKQALKTKELFDNFPVMEKIDYNEKIAKLIEKFLNDMEENSIENLKAKKEEQYKKLLEEPVILDDSELEDESGELDWVKFREKVLWPALDRLSKQKTFADIGFSFGLSLAFEVPFDFLKELSAQIEKIQKERKKRSLQNRKNHINAALKKHSLTFDKLGTLLAEDVMEWMLDDSSLKGLDIKRIKENTANKKIKKEIEKKEFVDQLKKDKNGNLCFNTFTKQQKRKYLKYLKQYSEEFIWRQKACYLTGVLLTKEEMNNILKNAIIQAFSAKRKGQALSQEEILKKLQEIQNKNPYIPRNRTNISVSTTINQLIDNINDDNPLSLQEQTILKQGLIKSGMAQPTVSTISKYLENNYPLPPLLKNNIFETLGHSKYKNPEFSLFAVKNKLSIQDVAKLGLQEQQTAHFITKWNNQALLPTHQNSYQRAG